MVPCALPRLRLFGSPAQASRPSPSLSSDLCHPPFADAVSRYLTRYRWARKRTPKFKNLKRERLPPTPGEIPEWLAPNLEKSRSILILRLRL